MKGVGFWMGAVCAMLLLVSLAAAEMNYAFPDSTKGYGTSQRRFADEYRTWFSELPTPQAQRILDPSYLNINRGDLATPAVLGAERVLEPQTAWEYGYDVNTGLPVLNPRGEKRVLKHDFGYGEQVITGLQPAPVLNRVMNFRQERVMLMANYLARKNNHLQLKHVRSRIPVQPEVSMDNLDMRPIFLNAYERQQGYLDLKTHSLLRARYLSTQPGISFSENQPLIGSGQINSWDLSRLSFLTRSATPVQGDLSTRTGPFNGGPGEASEFVLRNKFLGTSPGLVEYGGR